LIGLNHGILIGLAAGLISFIPYLGSLTGLVLSLCVVVLQFWPSSTMIPVVLGIFLAGQAIADYVLSPYLIASRVQLNPVWIMFAIAAFGYLFGFVGLLIAVPLAAAIGVKERSNSSSLPVVQSSYRRPRKGRAPASRNTASPGQRRPTD
jgi:predicted PurR-regulated permease PerM